MKYLLARDKKILLNRPLVMGILNITPDSFSDGGLYLEKEKAKQRVFEMIEQGADIIDIGAESSRPFAKPIELEQEKERISGLVAHLAEKNVIISIDTYKPEIAKVALEQGAYIVNDITGLRNEKMIAVISEFRAAVVIMHMQGNPETMQIKPKYSNPIDEIFHFLESATDKALKSNIDERSIILDPGIGFGKKPEDNFLILRELDKFLKIGFPMLIGASRKSFLRLLGFEDVDDRLEGSLAAAASSVLKGASIIRTHDVAETRKIIDSTWAIMFGFNR